MSALSLPGVPGRAHLTLLNRFTLLSAVILFLGATFIGWWTDRRIYQLVTEDSVEMGAVFVDSTIAPHLAELPSVDALSISQAAHLKRLIANNVDSGRYGAVNLWSPAGTLVYSTLPSPPDRPQSEVGLQAALDGQVFSYQAADVHGYIPATKHGPVMESYFPVLAADGTVLAVIDVYQNLADLDRSALDVRLQTWLVVGTATVLMFFLLYGIVRQGSETIQSQQAALERSRKQIQQAAVRAAALNEAAMRRIGADLHDGPAQDLGLARMRIEPLRQAVAAYVLSNGTVPLDGEGASYDLQLIDTALQSSLQEIRDLAGGLRLPELSELDLAQAIRKAATDYMRKTGRIVSVTGPELMPGGMALKSAAYRLVQESLNNGQQHGEPTRQSVEYCVVGKFLQIEVEDNGKGFDPACVQARGPRRQLGLAGLQERVEILGGELLVRSAPGQGTRVRAVLPLVAPELDTGV